MYDIVRYRVRYQYDIGRKIVRLFALIVRYLYVIAPYIGRTSAVKSFAKSISVVTARGEGAHGPRPKSDARA